MSLRFGLILGHCFVIVLAFVATVFWSMIEARERGEQQVSATLARVSATIETNRSNDPDENPATHVRRVTREVMQVLAPGTCTVFEEARVPRRRLCADWQVFGPIAPGWFRDLLGAVVGVPDTMATDGVRNRSDPYHAEVAFDPVAFATSVWNQVRLAAGQAVVMGLGVLVLGILLILYSTRPVQPIVARLGALDAGGPPARVPLRGFTEFRRIGAAVNELGDRMDRAEADRRALTRQLLEVEDAERRHLARDLHDEFGQILTATGALAAGIERRGEGATQEIAEDARAIGANVRRMMETLRGAFARLRPPELDTMGLAASLRQMVGGWSASGGGPVRFDLQFSDLDEAGLPPETALGLFRIAQEAITNAMRHGRPGRIGITLTGGGAAPVSLVIEDDGGGRIGQPGTGQGRGVLGISERVESMGGTLEVGNTGRGVRIAVRIPEGEGPR